MNAGRLIFTQVIDLLDRKEFQRCLGLYPMPRKSRSMTGRDQFLAMAFAQITFREGLRDIEACLRGSNHLYAMGIRGKLREPTSPTQTSLGIGECMKRSLMF